MKKVLSDRSVVDIINYIFKKRLKYMSDIPDCSGTSIMFINGRDKYSQKFPDAYRRLSGISKAVTAFRMKDSKGEKSSCIAYIRIMVPSESFSEDLEDTINEYVKRNNLELHIDGESNSVFMIHVMCNDLNNIKKLSNFKNYMKIKNNCIDFTSVFLNQSYIASTMKKLNGKYSACPKQQF